MAKKNKKRDKFTPTIDNSSDYLYSMSMAPDFNQGAHWFQLLPSAFFTAFVIMIVKMHQYQRPMNQFFWTNSGNDLTDFFSYYKMVAILVCTVFVLVFLVYRVFTQSFYIKRTKYYIPMIVYSVFVIISYVFSDYKEFSFFGYNDRFEGTIVLLAYMVMLFYIINSINNEKSIKWIIYSTAASSILLSLIGLSQYFEHDFFTTSLGKKLITPSWYWDHLNELIFNFKNGQIYQTVYNINYVSFYLTLLIPLFGLLFIYSVMKGKEERAWKKILWGVLFALNMFNLIGSESSGGFLGMGIVVFIALIILNKQILKLWKPIVIIFLITLIVGGSTYTRWMPELSWAVKGVLGNQTPQVENVGSAHKGHIDYMVTEGNDIIVSYEGNELTFTTFTERPNAVKLTDSKGKDIGISKYEGQETAFKIDDNRFKSFIIGPAMDSAGVNYLIIKIDEEEWPFAIMKGNEVRFRNGLGNLLSLKKTQAIGWEDNQGFGSGRGYIWSRTIPMLKDTIFIGHGADTYGLYFPQDDYVGKYNADWSSLNLIVDKPHNMYMGAFVGTGGISVVALLILWLAYVAQSVRLYIKREVNSFIDYAGLGIFLGICGFLVSGIVNDSTVSVMPMFYGMLGTGIAINLMLQKDVKMPKN